MTTWPTDRVPGTGEPNPVLVKELRARFRGPRAFAALTAFLILLTFFAWYLYRQYSESTYYSAGNFSSAAGAELGRTILMAVAMIEALFLALIAPSLTADAISGERERQTYDMLLATPLSGWGILSGKVGAAFGYVLLLAFSCLPVMSLAFIYGGVSLSSVLRIQSSLVAAGILYLAVGAFWSSLSARTARAGILTYVTVGALLLMPVLLQVTASLLRIRGMIDSESFAPWWALSLGSSPPLELAVASSGAGNGDQLWTSWFVALFFRLLVAAGLLLLASARIRPLGWRGQAAIFWVVLATLAWLVLAFAVHP